MTEDIGFFLAAVAALSAAPDQLIRLVPTGHHSRVYFIIDIQNKNGISNNVVLLLHMRLEFVSPGEDSVTKVAGH